MIAEGRIVDEKGTEQGEGEQYGREGEERGRKVEGANKRRRKIKLEGISPFLILQFNH